MDFYRSRIPRLFSIPSDTGKVLLSKDNGCSLVACTFIHAGEIITHVPYTDKIMIQDEDHVTFSLYDESGINIVGTDIKSLVLF